MKYIKQLTLSAIVFALVFSASIVARAQDDVETDARTGVSTSADLQMQKEKRLMEARANLEEKKEEMETRRENLKTNLEEKRMEIKKKLDEGVKERITKHARMIIARMKATIERVERLTDRLESRLEKMSEKGMDVSEAKRFLATARTEIGNAKNVQTGLEASLKLTLESDTPKETFTETFRTSIEQIKTSLKNAHRALTNAVISLKATGGIKADTSTSVETEI